MDYERIAEVVNEIKYRYVAAGTWDSELCNELVIHTRSIVLMVCRKRGVHRDDEADIVQRSYTDLFRNLHRIEDDRALPRYLYITADHLCQRYWRRKYRSPETPDVADYAVSHAEYRMGSSNRKDLTLREDLREAVGNLPDLYREMVEWYYYMGHTAQEIARLQGISINTVTSRLRRARLMLKEMMETDE